jgi:hypothetical protein
MADYMFGEDEPGGGRPGSDGLRGGRDPRLPLFAQGRVSDAGKPNAWRLMILWNLSGPDGSCPDATDDEAFGLLGQWGKAEAWVVSRKLAVVRELVRRRPAPGEDDAQWDDRLSREVALQLGMSVPGARKLICFAVALEDRLPRIGRAFDRGHLDPGRAKMITDETGVLDDLDALARAEQMILDGLPKCKASWAELQRLVQRAVCTVDPDGARKRREKAEREQARVLFWREAAGTCALLGTGLPTDESLAAQAHVEQRAQEYRAGGIKRPIDILRVASYLDLLNCVPVAERIARFRAEDAAVPAGQAADKADDGRQDGRTPADDDAGASGSGPWDHLPAEVPCAGCCADDCICRDWVPVEPPCEHCGHGACQCGATMAGSDPAGSVSAGSVPVGSVPSGGVPSGPDETSGHGSRRHDRGGSPGGAPVGDPGSTPASGPGSTLTSRVNLTLAEMDIPLLTVLGLARRPGEGRGLGVIAPDLARQLVEAAARSPDTTFCITITDEQGFAIGHGCCKPVRSARTGKAAKAQALPGPDPPAIPGAIAVTPGGKPGRPGGYGSWLMTLPGRAGAYRVELYPVPTGHCDHRYQSAAHDPGDLLRHLIHVRDGKCGFPACSRRARESDVEHAIPHAEGGKTCACNCWACSRSCHRLKQSAGWSVTETRPGFHQWTTPSGRTYTQEPWRYPA